jgi:prephenate dehydrogenase
MDFGPRLPEQSPALPKLRLANCRVAILGLGLMGGSLALALRGRCAHLTGIDPNGATLALAKEMGLADLLALRPGNFLEQTDLIILAAPVRTIVDLLNRLPQWQPNPAVVLDLGSTKADICAAMDGLPQRFEAVGGHPMAGKERSSLHAAEAGLYQGAPFGLIETKRSTPGARRLAEELAVSVGARPLWLDAATHDRWTAATSHLPYILSGALAAVTPVEAAPMIGPGFRSASRLAVTPVEIMLDVLQTNRDNLLEGLSHLRNQLDLVQTLLENENYTQLAAVLTGAAHQRRALLEAPDLEKQS